MYYFLSKWLPLFIMPPGSFFVLLLVAALFWYYRRTKIAFYVFLVSIIFLYVASNPWVAAKGIGFWESRVQMQSSREKLPATIVLGGMFGQDSPEQFGQPYQIKDSGDRILHGLRIFKEGKSRYLILSGGRNPLADKLLPESEIMHQFVKDHSSLPDSLVIQDPQATNTEENALYCRELMRERNLPLKAYIVTSALHMPRAAKVFREAGFEVYPQPTDFQRLSDNATTSIIGLMPNALAMKYNAQVMREMMGYVLYIIKYDLWDLRLRT